MRREFLFMMGLMLCCATQAASDVTPDVSPTAAAGAAPQAPDQSRQHCDPPAKTPVVPGKGACFSNLGSSYDGAQLNATGASYPADALHLLDPSVSIHK